MKWFKKYADVDSFVDMYLLDEIIKSTDVGWQSFYFVKEKEGKVYLTAPRDLEFSCGLNRGDQSYYMAKEEINELIFIIKL